MKMKCKLRNKKLFILKVMLHYDTQGKDFVNIGKKCAKDFVNI